MYTYIPIYTHTHLCTYICVYMYVYMSVYVCVYIGIILMIKTGLVKFFVYTFSEILNIYCQIYICVCIYMDKNIDYFVIKELCFQSLFKMPKR